LLIRPSSMTALLIFLNSSYSASTSLTLTARGETREREREKSAGVSQYLLPPHHPRACETERNGTTRGGAREGGGARGGKGRCCLQTVSLARTWGSSSPRGCLSSTSQHLSRTASSCLTPSRHCTMILAPAPSPPAPAARYSE
jgi:hypothetical protein